MKLQRIDLYGSGWQCPDPSVGPPTIFGDVTRDFDRDCVSVIVGVKATALSVTSNSWAVEPLPDAITVERLHGEPYFVGLDPSLVARTAAMRGTSRPWLLTYRDA